MCISTRLASSTPLSFVLKKSVGSTVQRINVRGPSLAKETEKKKVKAKKEKEGKERRKGQPVIASQGDLLRSRDGQTLFCRLAAEAASRADPTFNSPSRIGRMRSVKATKPQTPRCTWEEWPTILYWPPRSKAGRLLYNKQAFFRCHRAHPPPCWQGRP